MNLDVRTGGKRTESSGSYTISVMCPDTYSAGDLIVLNLCRYDASDLMDNPEADGWVLCTDRIVASRRFTTYVRIASASESARWGYAQPVDGKYYSCTNVYYGDFDTANPILAVSDVEYSTNDTSLIAGSVTCTVANHGIIFCGGAYDVASITLSTPSNFSDPFTGYSTAADFVSLTTHSTYYGPGATGIVTSTISASENDKHAVLLLLRPPVQIVDISAISGVTAPVAGATPDTTHAGNAQIVAGTVSWSPSTNPHPAGTEITATVTVVADEGYTLVGVPANFFTIAGAECTNAADSGVITAVFPTTAATVTTLDIPGVTVPAAGVAPDTAVTETLQYTGVVSWSPSTNPHPVSTVCTATITLTAKTGYTFYGVSANSFTVSGATSVSNSANSGVITAEFPATAATVTDLSIGGVTAPVAGATPVSTITSEAQFTGSVSWSPTPTGGVFQPGVAYTANITRTPASGYTFYGFAADSATVAGATVTNSANSGNAAALFPATASTITLTELAGIEVPELGNSQDTAGTETAQYTVSIDSYSPDDDPLEAATAYTLGITVTPKAGWTLFGLPANTFTVPSATVMHSANYGAVSALFGETESYPITISEIEGVTPPVTNETPVSTITATAEFTGACAWSPNNATFRPGTEYTVVITLTAEDEYSFAEVTEDFFTVAGAIATNDAGSGIVTAVFPVTEPGTYARPGFFFQGI